MARLKDHNWNLPEGIKNQDGTTSHVWDSVQVAVLMDLRDELKKLNSLLYCRNFQDIPRRLNRIVLNTTKKKRGTNVRRKH